MRKRGYGIAIAAVVAALSMMPAATASAATEFGDGCIANTGSEAFSVFQIGSTSPLPQAAPSAGVITRWKTSLIPGVPFAVPQQLQVVRVTGPTSAQIVGESASQAVVSGSNAFDTRIPVQAGDRLGLTGPGEIKALLCESTSAADVVGAYAGTAPAGSTVTFFEAAGEARVPVAAILEPDVDGDGFGDETQDRCPQSAAFQVECPVVIVNAVSAIKKKGSVIVMVTTTGVAPVTVSGTVNLGKGRKANLSSKAKTVAPGTVGRLTLRFPKSLKNKLAKLPTKKSLRLKVTATATDMIGRLTTDKLNVRLKGQAKPERKGPKKK